MIEQDLIKIDYLVGRQKKQKAIKSLKKNITNSC